MEIETQILEIGRDTQNANQIKDLILQTLLENEEISQETAENYSEKWQVILIKSNWFEKWMNKFNKKKNSWYYRYIKFED